MLRNVVQRMLAFWDLELVPRSAFPAEASDSDKRVLGCVQPYTMTSSDRLWALMQSVRYIVNAAIPGDFVECGVWRGGSAMAMALMLRELGQADRRMWLYDTFSGMTPPTKFDVESYSGRTAAQVLDSTRRKPGRNVWCVASKEDVSANLASTGYPAEHIKIVPGDVTETLRHEIPEQIALLRLDTDWYESTAAELALLYPRLTSGGVCILDDYGYWQGARKAVDEYFQTHDICALLHKVDSTGRIFLKP